MKAAPLWLEVGHDPVEYVVLVNGGSGHQIHYLGRHHVADDHSRPVVAITQAVLSPYPLRLLRPRYTPWPWLPAGE